MAHFPAQANRQQVKLLHETRISRQNPIQPRMRIASFRDQAHAAHHPAYVGVGWKNWAIEREEQHNARCFWPHSRKCQQPGQCILQWEILEKRKVKATTCIHNSVKSFSN